MRNCFYGATPTLFMMYSLNVRRVTFLVKNSVLTFHSPRPIEKSIAYVGAKRYSKLDNEVRSIDLMNAFKRTVTEENSARILQFQIYGSSFQILLFLLSIVLFFVNTFR